MRMLNFLLAALLFLPASNIGAQEALKNEKTINIKVRSYKINKPFDQVVKKLKSQIGEFGPPQLQEMVAKGASRDEIVSRIQQDLADNQFGPVYELPFGKIVSLATGKPIRMVKFGIGNPLRAGKLIRENPAFGLHPPISILVFESNSATQVETVVPSSFFDDYFDDKKVLEMSNQLDLKVEKLIESLGS